jgi:hypothetical protein
MFGLMFAYDTLRQEFRQPMLAQSYKQSAPNDKLCGKGRGVLEVF